MDIQEVKNVIKCFKNCFDILMVKAEGVIQHLLVLLYTRELLFYIPFCSVLDLIVNPYIEPTHPIIKSNL